jgi:diguanylate cyclase (GGDEF)-like protein
MNGGASTHRSNWLVTAAGLLVVGVIGLADYWTGHDLDLSTFYLIPIFFVAWMGGRHFGILVAFIGALINVTLYLAVHPPVLSPTLFYFNVAFHAAIFPVAGILFESVRIVLTRERRKARRDSLTGMANREYFYEIAGREIERCRRYGRAFTLAYIDCDNFKFINDRFGHQTGDELLRTVSSTLLAHTRESDIAARIGGDEFVVGMPEISAEAAKAALAKLQLTLEEVMRKRGWPVTFSIGVVTFATPPKSLDTIIHEADTMMYSSKGAGKRLLRHTIFNA